MRAHLQEHLYGFDDNFRMWEFTVHGSSFLYKQVSRTSNIQRSFYRPQTKFAKVMFSQVSVCLQGGGSLSREGGLSRGVSVHGGLCLRGSLSGGVSVQDWSLSGRSLSRGSLSKGGLCQGYPCTVMSGRYASYRNAFLFFLSSLIIFIKYFFQLK